MKSSLVILAVFFASQAIAQQKDSTVIKKLLAELAENACKCADSINVYDKSKADIVKELNKCIDEQVTVYQLGTKLLNIDTSANSKDGNGDKQKIEIVINTNRESDEYKKYYFEMERYLMANCKSVKEKVATNDKLGDKSLSTNREALEYYFKGIDESKSTNEQKAIEYFKKAVKFDPEFAFAWDNLGICYRKLGDFDKAIDAYNKSLEIDPKGITPLQNIAIAYMFKKDFEKAISAYQKLSEIEKDNPEVYYGIGNIYANYMGDYEKGLSNMCKAYNLYTQQKSPYRTDAEKIINIIYVQMKKQGKEGRFNEILKENNISPQ